jgi:hypothetical protein
MYIINKTYSEIRYTHNTFDSVNSGVSAAPSASETSPIVSASATSKVTATGESIELAIAIEEASFDSDVDVGDLDLDFVRALEGVGDLLPLPQRLVVVATRGDFDLPLELALALAFPFRLFLRFKDFDLRGSGTLEDLGEIDDELMSGSASFPISLS